MAGSSDEPEDKNLRVMARWRSTGRVLVEALPYILKYDQKTIVVKYGGNAMTGSGGTDDFSQDIVLMKQTLSITVSKCGSRSEIHCPLWPAW